LTYAATTITTQTKNKPSKETKIEEMKTFGILECRDR